MVKADAKKGIKLSGLLLTSLCIGQWANYFLSIILLMYLNIFVGLDLSGFCTFIFMLYFFISSSVIWPILHFICVSLLFKNSWFNQVGFFVHSLSLLHNEKSTHLCTYIIVDLVSCPQFLTALTSQKSGILICYSLLPRCPPNFTFSTSSSVG